jgi:ABC-type microcin C transport system duplicated ATPase subunit YejF
MGLNPKKNTITTGEALFNGENLLRMPSKRLRDIRGNDIAMIFQDPMTSLNPVHSVGKQLVEAIQLHQDVSKRQRRTARSICSRRSGSRAPTARSTTTRTSSRAGCASA